MTKKEFKKRISLITDKDKRYPPDAYDFINAAISYATEKLMENGRKRHINGRELLEKIGEFAINSFGPMAETVFEYWGLTDSLAIGHMVFNMAEHNLLTISEDDSLDDFKGFNFKKVFSLQTQPVNRNGKRSKITIV